MDLAARLKAFLAANKIPLKRIADEIKIPLPNLYKWKAGHRPSNIEDYNKLIEYLNAYENKAAEAPSTEYITGSAATIRLPLHSDRNITAQASGEAATGTIIMHNDQPELIVYRIDAPFIGEAEGAIGIFSESMEPTLTNGCWIAITRLKFPDILNWGECYYIVDKNWHGMVRRIYSESADSIRLVSDYKDQNKYPPIIRHWNEIEAIFKIQAVIQKH